MNEHIAQVGQYLRYEREKLNLSVQDVAGQLLLPADTIKGLEDGDYADLPEAVYIRGYIRSYCTLLGVDSGPALKMFAEAIEIDQSLSEEPVYSPLVDEHVQRLTRLWGSLLFVTIIIIILVGGWYERERYSVTVPASEDKLVSEITVDEKPDMPSSPVGEEESVYMPYPQATTSQDSYVKESDTSSHVTEPDTVSVTIVASGDSWAHIYNIGSESMVRRMLSDGYRKSFTVHFPLRIEFGAARNIRLWFNDVEYDLAPHTSNLNTAFFLLEESPINE